MEPAFTPLIVDASEDEVDPADLSEPELYTPGELPRPRFVMLGQQGGSKFKEQFVGSLLLLFRTGYLVERAALAGRIGNVTNCYPEL